jgi:hypothetical protein
MSSSIACPPRVIALVGLALSLVGCAADPAASEVDSAEPEALTSALSSRPRISAVTSNGLGCPAGTIEAHVSHDGSSATVDFDRLAVDLSRGSFIAMSDCLVMVKIKSPAGVQYALDTLSADGEAAVDSGLEVASLTLGSYFMGSPLPVDDEVLDLTQAASGPISIGGDVADDQLRWSSCAAPRDIQVRTRLELQSATHDDVAHASVSSIKLKLRWHVCEG